MKAIGAPQSDIMLMYIGVVLMFSLLALFVSIPLGIVSARALSVQLASLLNFDINSFRVPLQVILLEFGAGLAVPFIAAIYPIISGTRITVREAISTGGSGAGQFGTGRFDKLLGKLRGTSAATLYAIRNIFRRKTRLALTLIALSLGGAIFIAVLSVDASLTLTVDRDTSAYWQQDITINFQRPYRTQRVIREALKVPGLVDIEGWGTKTGYRVHPNGHKSKEDISIFVVPADTRFIEPNVLEGRWLNVDDTNALVINVYMLDKEPDVHIGDEIELEIEGRTDTWHIVGLVTTQMVGFEEPRLELPIAYANYDYLAKVLGQAGQVDRIVIETEQDFESFHTEVAQALEEHLASKGIHIRSLETNSMLRSLSEDIIGILTNLLAFMAVLFALVGGLSLMSTMSLNVLERTREIGVLRAIGASNAIVSQIIIYEGVFIGLLSWLLAFILAIPLSMLLSNMVGITLLNTPLHYSFPISNVFVWFVVAVIISTLASYLPARNASKLSVREVLSYE
jgi:putative ABC transport system permease protein